MALTKEQEKALLNRSSMIGAAQGPLTLGGAGNVPAYGDSRLTGGGVSVPPFPSNFANIGPETTSKPIPFAGGGTASMGLGRANVNYPSRLGLAGGDYGTRFQFGADEFGGARLPQASGSLTASPTGFDRPISFMDARSAFNQTSPQNPASPMGATIAGFTPAGMQPRQTSIPIGGGPVSMGIASTGPTQEQQGKTEIKTPRGSMWATPEQAAAMATPRTAGQQSSRSPDEQQALLDNIRKNAPALNQQRTDWVMNTIQQRRENPTTYTTPSGMSAAVPTNRFGEPLKAWMDQLGKEGRLNDRSKPAPQSTVTMFPSVVSSGRFENENSFNPSESFTGSMASNYAPPTTLGFGNRTRISGQKRNSSPMSEGIMPAFDFGMSVVPSYMPNFPIIPPNNAMATGVNPSPFGSNFSSIF
jgi:hypothetical protein